MTCGADLLSAYAAQIDETFGPLEIPAVKP